MTRYKKIPGFRKFYRVGEDGSVWSRRIKGSKFQNKYGFWWRMRTKPRKDGYQQVCLHDKGEQTIYLVHILVLTLFDGPCPDGMECRHLDGVRHNNVLSNLKWGTPKENAKDCDTHGHRSKGTDRWNAKLNPKKVRKIKELHATGNYSQGKLGRMYGVHQTTIRNVVLGKNWK